MPSLDRAPQLEDQLVLVAEIDLLDMLAPMQVPEVDATPVSTGQEFLRNQTVLE